MRIVFGAPVRSSDGREVGTIDRLILDPATDDLKAIAIRCGGPLQHDIEVPIGAVRPGPDGALRLTTPASRLEQFPPFIESNYTAAPAAYARAALASDEAAVLIGSLCASPPRERPPSVVEAGERLVRMFSEQDLANAVVGRGSAVRDRAGRRVGKVGDLTFDDATGHLTGVTIRRGVAAAETLALPAGLVARVDDGVIELTVDAAWLDLWTSLDAGVEVWTSDRARLGEISARSLDHLIVTSPDGRHRTCVPLTAVGRLSRNRLLLTADHARAVFWTAPAP
jgi:sporulation protein YlmC with PRC-barrel domain